MLTVNGEPLEYEPGMTVGTILERRKYVFRMLAIWVNGEFVPRKEWPGRQVPDGADVQVIHMVAGG
jgi:sulfur carrier protein